MANRVEKGRQFEDRAADFLLSLGYTLITRRFKVREGEIDLICLDGDVLVFVEVKARTSLGQLPEEAIGEEKLTRLQRAAQVFLSRNEESRVHRFDVVAIDPGGLRHHKHIFGN